MASLVRSRRGIGITIALVAALATLIAYLMLTAGPAKAKEFATLHVLEGMVDVRPPNGGEFRAGMEGDTLREGDTVRTGENGRAEIEYFDGSRTRLDTSTTFTLVELTSDPGVAGRKVIRGKQGSGTTLNRVVKLTDSQSRFDVSTPSAVASVRGTEYVVLVHPNGSSEYWVISGVVAVLLEDGSTITLEAGKGVLVSASGTPGEIFDVDLEDAAELCELDEQFCPVEDPAAEVVLAATDTREETDPPPDDPGTGTETTSTDTGGDGTPPADDETPPDSSIDGGPSGEQDSRSASFAFSSNEPGSSFECSLDDGPYEDCDSPKEYDGLPDGEHTFRVRAVDAAGNTGSEKTSTWQVSAPPDTSIDSGPDPTVDSRSALFDVSSDEEDATFECRLDDEESWGSCPGGGAARAFTAAGASTGLTLDDLADGPHALRVRARDSSNKVDETPAEWDWSVDGVPDTFILSAPDAETENDSATFVIGSDEEGVSFECRLDDEEGFGSCPEPEVEVLGRTDASTMTVAYTALETGAHTFQARAVDPGDKADATPAQHDWTIAVIEPDTAIDAGPSGIVASTSATFEFSSDTAGATFECSLDNAAFTGCTSPKNYTVANGPHTFQVRAISPSGTPDSTPAVRNWRVGDPTAITITLAWPGPPRDLDLHATTPSGGHVYYGNRCIDAGSGCWIQLDRDVTNADARGTGSPGSETITIFPSEGGFQPGSYVSNVVNFACDAAFDGSDAQVSIFGGGVDQTVAVAGASGSQTSKQWDTATVTIAANGTASLSLTQSLSGATSCGAAAAPREASARTLVFFDGTEASSTPLLLWTPTRMDAQATEGGNVRVEWEPADLAAQVRIGYEGFATTLEQGEPGCNGTGHCRIDGIAPGTRVWITVFPEGTTEIEAIEGVNAILFVVPDQVPSGGGQDDGTSGGPGSGGGGGSSDPGDDDPEPPTQEPPPAVTDEDPPPDEPTPDGGDGGDPEPNPDEAPAENTPTEGG